MYHWEIRLSSLHEEGTVQMDCKAFYLAVTDATLYSYSFSGFAFVFVLSALHRFAVVN